MASAFITLTKFSTNRKLVIHKELILRMYAELGYSEVWYRETPTSNSTNHRKVAESLEEILAMLDDTLPKLT